MRINSKYIGRAIVEITVSKDNKLDSALDKKINTYLVSVGIPSYKFIEFINIADSPNFVLRYKIIK